MARPKLEPILVAAALLSIGVSKGGTFSEWQFRQQLEISSTGLTKFSLPLDTIDSARPDLADLRLTDASGNEIPYLIELPQPTGKELRIAKSFKVELDPSSTIIHLETGMTQPLGSLQLITPSASFIKAVSVAGSADGKTWQAIASGQPIFRQPNGASQLRLELPPGPWAFLRLTVDDRGSPPVPFTGAEVQAALAEPVPIEPVAIQISDRVENPGETRLTLNFAAAHLRLASLEIESPDPFFRRQVAVVVRQVEENTIKEKSMANGSIFRVAVAGQPVSARLSVPLDLQTPSRELSLIIQNGDSPPLPVTRVRGQRRPVYLLFFASAPGRYDLLTGNPLSTPPRYDLASQGIDFKTAPLSAIHPSSIAPNSTYRTPEPLPRVTDKGAILDASEWRFRKSVKIPSPGAQQLELDLEVLARAQPGFADLRLGHDGKQIPFIIERTSRLRSIKPQSARADDSNQHRLSRWMLKAPQAGLPFAKVICTSQTALFRREVSLYEEPMDSRGAKYRRPLGSATWVQAPEHANQTFVLSFLETPRTDTFFLEANNEDNPSIELSGFELSWLAVRLFFKTSASDNVFLFYGNPEVAAPRYDLSLVANQLLTADKVTASLGPEERLKNPSWADRQKPGQGGWLLWGVLVIVVVALLAVIARMIPKQTSKLE